MTPKLDKKMRRDVVVVVVVVEGSGERKEKKLKKKGKVKEWFLMLVCRKPGSSLTMQMSGLHVRDFSSVSLE